MDYEELSDDEGQEDVFSSDFLNYNESDISQEDGSDQETVNEIIDLKDSGDKQIEFSHHGTNMFKGLKELRDSKEILDLTLKVNEGGREGVILVHSCVLASHSPFVRTFLRDGGKNKGIDLSQWSKEVINTLVDWMYDGVLKIKSTNCLKLLESSHYLRLDEVSQGCASYICDHLTVENCCEAYMALSNHKILKFKERVDKFFLTNFVDLLKGNNLMQLPTDDFLSFLKDDNLLLVNNYGFVVLPHEEEVILFNLLKNYIKRNNLHNLWLCIIKDVLRFGLMEKNDIQQLLSSEEWLGECKERGQCLQHLKKIVSSGRELSTFNSKSRAGSRGIKYFWTPIVAFVKVSFPIDYDSFDDVDSILNELKSSGSPPVLYVTGMKLYTTLWYNHLVISAIEVTYNTHKTVLHGKALNVVGVHEFKLQPGERIINIQGRAGWLLDCLKFVSNFGQTFGPYGGTDGDEKHFQPKSSKSYLVGLKGCVSIDNIGHPYVRRLRFAWGSVM